MKASRATFGRVRKDRWARWEVYEAPGTYLLFFSWYLTFLDSFSVLPPS